jgi:hypothetical protein
VNGIKNSFFFIILLSSTFLQGMEERERRIFSPSVLRDPSSPHSYEERMNEVLAAEEELDHCIFAQLPLPLQSKFQEMRKTNIMFSEVIAICKNVEKSVKHNVFSHLRRKNELVQPTREVLCSEWKAKGIVSVLEKAIDSMISERGAPEYRELLRTLDARADLGVRTKDTDYWRMMYSCFCSKLSAFITAVIKHKDIYFDVLFTRMLEHDFSRWSKITPGQWIVVYQKYLLRREERTRAKKILREAADTLLKEASVVSEQ